MNIGQLSSGQQSSFAEDIARMAYPVYCHTGVQDLDYHFIGTGFLFRFAKRYFFILTDHQVKLALNRDIFFTYTDTEKGIWLNPDKTLRFEHSDLVVCELEASDIICKFPCVDERFLRQPADLSDLEFIVVGYQRKINFTDWENKLIKPKVGAIISYKCRIEDPSETIELDLSTVPLGKEHQFETFEDLTQGLSGAPIFGFKFNSASKNIEADVYFMGITSFVAETEKTLYGTRLFELLSCLNAGFHVFAEFEASNSNQQLL